MVYEMGDCEFGGGDWVCFDCGWWDFGVNFIGV